MTAGLIVAGGAPAAPAEPLRPPPPPPPAAAPATTRPTAPDFTGAAARAIFRHFRQRTTTEIEAQFRYPPIKALEGAFDLPPRAAAVHIVGQVLKERAEAEGFEPLPVSIPADEDGAQVTPPTKGWIVFRVVGDTTGGIGCFSADKSEEVWAVRLDPDRPYFVHYYLYLDEEERLGLPSQYADALAMPIDPAVATQIGQTLWWLPRVRSTAELFDDTGGSYTGFRAYCALRFVGTGKTETLVSSTTTPSLGAGDGAPLRDYSMATCLGIADAYCRQAIPQLLGLETQPWHRVFYPDTRPGDFMAPAERAFEERCQGLRQQANGLRALLEEDREIAPQFGDLLRTIDVAIAAERAAAKEREEWAAAGPYFYLPRTPEISGDEFAPVIARLNSGEPTWTTRHADEISWKATTALRDPRVAFKIIPRLSPAARKAQFFEIFDLYHTYRPEEAAPWREEALARLRAWVPGQPFPLVVLRLDPGRFPDHEAEIVNWLAARLRAWVEGKETEPPPSVIEQLCLWPSASRYAGLVLKVARDHPKRRSRAIALLSLVDLSHRLPARMGSELRALLESELAAEDGLANAPLLLLAAGFRESRGRVEQQVTGTPSEPRSTRLQFARSALALWENTRGITGCRTWLIYAITAHDQFGFPSPLDEAAPPVRPLETTAISRRLMQMLRSVGPERARALVDEMRPLADRCYWPVSSHRLLDAVDEALEGRGS